MRHRLFLLYDLLIIACIAKIPAQSFLFLKNLSAFQSSIHVNSAKNSSRYSKLEISSLHLLFSLDKACMYLSKMFITIGFLLGFDHCYSCQFLILQFNRGLLFPTLHWVLISFCLYSSYQLPIFLIYPNAPLVWLDITACSEGSSPMLGLQEPMKNNFLND
jgi:hypothetical protein